MNVTECAAKLLNDRFYKFFAFQLAVFDAVAERAAVNILHRIIQTVSIFALVKNFDDVFVVEVVTVFKLLQKQTSVLGIVLTFGLYPFDDNPFAVKFCL